MCMKNNLVHARTCVYNVNYHVVWSVKYRRPILKHDIEIALKQMLRAIANDKDFIISEVEVGHADHVHVLISAHPKLSISYMVKMLKGISGRKLFEQFPEIRTQLWKGQLWNHSYYVETVGSIREDMIAAYIKKQEKGY